MAASIKFTEVSCRALRGYTVMPPAPLPTCSLFLPGVRRVRLASRPSTLTSYCMGGSEHSAAV